MSERGDALFSDMQEVFPGGVNSPVRAYRAVDGRPRIMRRGEGAEIVDEDGRRFIDFVGSFGPLILGHAHPIVTEAIIEAARDGTSFGAPCERELALAQLVRDFVPWMETLRFVSSGTEATMSAIRVARGFTGRDLIVKFSGCYHGHADHLLVAAGSGLKTFGQPSSAGVPEAFAEKTRVLPLDDEAAVDELFARDGDQIAAIILEPIPANNGLLLQRIEYLRHLREITAKHGALLIFDEVISGFRVAPGGAAELLQIQPDLATYGKVIGGGLPVGAFGGRREVMSVLAPDGPVYQAGTLSGNPVAMAAGAAALETLCKTQAYDQLEAHGSTLQALAEKAIERSGAPVRWVRQGSLFWLAMDSGDAPRRAETIPEDAGERYRPIFSSLLEQGILLAPSAYEVGFLSTAHTVEHLERFAAALEIALSAGG